MEHDFRRRCEAALTHPVTLAALGALLVNDVVFKTLFPGAWAVGKLSDLAWVVFASPLMAFALSFAVPKSAAGRRATLIAAYGGLPLLYAAFNTFAPVHDAIMRVILIGADGAARGAPMDATDSLAIPFGLAIAAWIWRRGVPAGGRLRFRFAALAVCAAALACLASPCNSERAEGVTLLAATSDGAILAGSGSLAMITGSGEIVGDYRFYGRSDDGGMSWSQNDDVDYEFDDSTFQAAKTPRGEYVITDSGIALIGEDGQGEIVYSTEYLLGDANRWMQRNDTREIGRRVLATRPNDILYHADSGNVVAAMGIQGAAAGTPDGRWRRVAVGQYSPTDFSFFAKTRAMGWVVGAIALTLSLSALTIAAAASAYEYDRERDSIYVILIALGCLGAIGLMFTAPALAAPIAALTSWTAMIAAAFQSDFKFDGGGKRRFALLGCVSTLPLSLGLLLVFGPVTGYTSPSASVVASLIIDAVALAAFISLIPPLAYHARFIARHWRPFALAFLGMNALVALAFLLWVQMNVSLAATQAAIVGLVGLAAVVLVRHVRGGLRDAASWQRARRG